MQAVWRSLACRKRVVSRRFSRSVQFAVDEEPEALLEGEGRDVGHLELLDEGLIHAREAQGLQFVEGGMREH